MTNKNIGNLIARAEDQYQSNNYNESIKTLQEVLRIDPNNNCALINISDIFLKLKLNQEAERYALKAYELYGNEDDLAVVNYSCILIDSKKYDDAIRILQNCKINGSSNYLVYNNLGYSYYLVGQYDKALENYNISISLYEANDLAYCNRGILKFYIFNDNDGIQDLLKAEKLGDIEAKMVLKTINKTTVN